MMCSQLIIEIAPKIGNCYFSKLLSLFPKTCPSLPKLLSLPFAYVDILSIISVPHAFRGGEGKGGGGPS